MAYKIGTILHGNNTRIGNLWIITKDDSYEGSMLWDGGLSLVAPTDLYKRETMSNGMLVADAFDVARIMGSWANLPVWANNLISTKDSQLVSGKANVQIVNPAVIKSIESALGQSITTRQKMIDNGLIKMHSKDESGVCPARKDGGHFFASYHGFTDTFDFCIHCDYKRPLRTTDV